MRNKFQRGICIIALVIILLVTVACSGNKEEVTSDLEITTTEPIGSEEQSTLGDITTKDDESVEEDSTEEVESVEEESSANQEDTSDEDTSEIESDDHVHEFGEWRTVSEATCVDLGEERRACHCGETESQAINAKGHIEIIDRAKSASCTENGLTEGKHCYRCGAIIAPQTYVEALGHDEVIDEAIAPTCTFTGLSEGKHCSRCGETLVAQTKVDKIDHVKGEPVYENTIEATATEDGKYDEVIYCTSCGEELARKIVVIPALGEEDPEDETTTPDIDEHVHSYSVWTIIAEATCIDNGTKERVCSCGEKETQSINAKGHNEAIQKAKAPTCTEKGSTEGRYCSVCHEILKSAETVDALGHGEVVDNAIPATCTNSGLTAGKHCGRCDEVIVAQETISALGHDEKTVASIAPTCTESGRTEGKYCARCNETLVEQESVSALGHTEVVNAGQSATCTENGYTEGKYCSLCNVVLLESEIIVPTGHTVAIDEAVKSTCQQTGLTEGAHCLICGEILVEQEETTMAEHIESSSLEENRIDPSCTESGQCDIVIYCSVCLNELERTTIQLEATGHSEVEIAAKAPTCTELGATAGSVCRVCDIYIVVPELIDALGHSWNDGTMIKEPTCTENGLKLFECVCGETMTQDVAASGHTDGETVRENVQSATCTENGSYDNVICCSVCGEEIFRQTVIEYAHGHNLVQHGAKEPTATEVGWDAYEECTNCDYTTYEEIPAKGSDVEWGGAISPI